MFRFLITQLMLCSLGVHTVLGCCWHHAHADCACESQSNPEGRIEKRPRRHIHLGCGDHHHHESDRPESSPGVPKPADCPHDQQCKELPCIYLVGSPSKLPLPEIHQLDETPRLITLRDAPQEVSAPGRLGQWEASLPIGSSTLGVRHATQVWLI